MANDETVPELEQGLRASLKKAWDKRQHTWGTIPADIALFMLGHMAFVDKMDEDVVEFALEAAALADSVAASGFDGHGDFPEKGVFRDRPVPAVAPEGEAKLVTDNSHLALIVGPLLREIYGDSVEVGHYRTAIAAYKLGISAAVDIIRATPPTNHRPEARVTAELRDMGWPASQRALDTKEWACLACREYFLIYHPIHPKFCPHCGAAHVLAEKE